MKQHSYPFPAQAVVYKQFQWARQEAKHTLQTKSRVQTYKYFMNGKNIKGSARAVNLPVVTFFWERPFRAGPVCSKQGKKESKDLQLCKISELLLLCCPSCRASLLVASQEGSSGCSAGNWKDKTQPTRSPDISSMAQAEHWQPSTYIRLLTGIMNSIFSARENMA